MARRNAVCVPEWRRRLRANIKLTELEGKNMSAISDTRKYRQVGRLACGRPGRGKPLRSSLFSHPDRGYLQRAKKNPAVAGSLVTVEPVRS